jgi:hypothetical protein
MTIGLDGVSGARREDVSLYVPGTELSMDDLVVVPLDVV